MAKPKRGGPAAGRARIGRASREEVEGLRRRLAEAEESLEAIRTGAVDALVINGPFGEQIYTLRDADRAYRAVIETMRDGVVTFREDGLILYANQQFASLLGRRLEDIMGGDIFELAGQGGEALKRLAVEAVPAGARSDVTFGGAAGSSLLNVSLTPMQIDGLGALSGVVADVSEERRQEQRIRLMERNEALGRLAGGIAHDLNNILQPIIVNTELLLETTTPDSQQYALIKNVLQAAHRQKGLVKRILSFTRPDKPAQRPVAVAPVVAEALKLLVPSLPKKIETRFIEQSNAGVVIGDATEIHELAVNLVTNAADALRETGGTIEVALRDVVLSRENPKLDLGPGRYLKLTVTDNGRGIPPADLERIFEPFFTTKEDGTGIGLSVVRSIINSLRGKIFVESKVGKGTLMTVFLPSGDVERPQPAATAVGRRSKAQGFRVLVVDDESLVLDTMRRALETLGYRPTPLKDAAAGLALVRSLPNHFDLALIDQNMPRMSGLQLASELKKIRTDLPIVLATGYSRVVEERTLQEAGVTAVVMKPLSLKELAAALEKALEKGPKP